MSKLVSIFLIIAFLACPVQPATNPDTVSTPRPPAHWHFGFGIGPLLFGYSRVQSAGGGYLVHYSYTRDHKVYGIRFAHLEEWDFDPFSYGEPAPENHYLDAALLFGRSFKFSRIEYIMATGCGITKSTIYSVPSLPNRRTYHDWYDKDTRLNLAIPAQIQLIWSPFPGLGIGIDVFGNYNPWHSFGGLYIVLADRKAPLNRKALGIIARAFHSS